jgi:predicted NAD/FAD-binding protein
MRTPDLRWPRIAVVGSGISGLVAAHGLKDHAQVTLFEAGSYFGGHTHTVDVTLPGTDGQLIRYGVDTGFLVFNTRTYPGLLKLFKELDVTIAPSDMSFSVQVPQAFGQQALEWNGADLDSVFAQRANVLRPRFWRLLRDILRFNQLATRLALDEADDQLWMPLQDFLKQHRFDTTFQEWYLLPMLGCIWSCPTEQMLRFPVVTMVRFCHNHGLIQVNGRPQWLTVQGGARHYVDKILAGLSDTRLNTPITRIERDAQGVWLHTQHGSERFDEVVLATHSDQALRLLAQPTAQEQAVLGAIRYHPNRAWLHTDASVMPRRTKAWAAWNYERGPAQDDDGSRHVCLHYWLNRLQPLPFRDPVFVSLNPLRPLNPQHVLQEIHYEHPVFDLGAIQAQQHVPSMQGHHRTWFAGAWMGYGFHEDGLRAAQSVVQQWLLRHQAVPLGGMP